MKFSDIYGMEKAKQELRAMADSGQMPHALLLHGPTGIGKMRLARALVQYICCKHHVDGDSCGVCPSCLQTDGFNNPDIHYVYPIVKRSSPSITISADCIDRWREMLTRHSYMPPEQWLNLLEAGNSQPMIYVSESEEMLRVASLSAYGSGYKIFVVWLPEKLNTDAANKILKLVEEPFPDTIFIMVSNDPGGILPTIFSRLQRVSVNPPEEREVISWLSGFGISEDDATRIARISCGNMAKAGELAESTGESIDFASIFKDTMRSAYSRQIASLRAISDKAAGFGREKSLRLLDYFSRMIRENYIYNLGIGNLTAMTRDEEEFSRRFSPFIHSGNVEAMHKTISSAKLDISRNANAKIVWFDTFLIILRLLRLSPNSTENQKKTN